MGLKGVVVFFFFLLFLMRVVSFGCALAGGMHWSLASACAFISCDQNGAQAIYDLPILVCLGVAGFPEKPLFPNLPWGFVAAPGYSPFAQPRPGRDPNRRGALVKGGKCAPKGDTSAQKGALKWKDDRAIYLAMGKKYAQ